MDDPSDSELMRRLASGEDLALNALIDRWRMRLIAFLNRSCGSSTIAADLAQETFVKLYRSCRDFRPGSSFSAYLFTIAANLARNHHRWVSRHPECSLEGDAAELTLRQADTARDPRQEAEAADRAFAIDAAFKSLPEDLRTVFHLHLHEGLSHVEIAQISGCSIKAVESRIYRARQMLKESLKSWL